MKRILLKEDFELLKKGKDGFYYTELNGTEYKVLVRIFGSLKADYDKYNNLIYYDSSNGPSEVAKDRLFGGIFIVLKETPKGYWFVSRESFRLLTMFEQNVDLKTLKEQRPWLQVRWCSSEATKRYAYPDEKSALKNFYKRQLRREMYVKSNLERVQRSLRLSKKLLNLK